MMDPSLRLSVSKVKCYDSCHKKFKYTYILKTPRKEWDFYVFGKLLHKALEEFHFAYLNGSKEPFNKTMPEAFKIAKFEQQDKLKPEMAKECFQILLQYLKIVSLNKNHLLSRPIKAVEQNFELPLNDQITLVGAIDRTQIDPDQVLHVADYKTSKNKKFLENDPFQLMTYAMVLMMQDPTLQMVRASYILLRHNFEPITWTFNRDEIMKIKDKYLDYANKIINEVEYEANPSKMCRFCDFIDQCEQGQRIIGNFNGEVNW